MDKEINSELLICRDISVVLRNRADRRQYIESYLLHNIVYSNGQFWGKFANVHPPAGHDELPQQNMLSYAYNNFSPVVCTMSLSDRMERYYSADAYSEITFVANGRYRKIWSGPGGGYNSAILESVRSGLKMKALIESNDSYIYVLPIHTLEVYEEERDFFAETEFDGYPERFRHFKEIELLGKRFTEFVKDEPNAPYAHTGYDFSKPYFLSSFLIKRDSVLHRVYDENYKLSFEEFAISKVEIWVESD